MCLHVRERDAHACGYGFLCKGDGCCMSLCAGLMPWQLHTVVASAPATWSLPDLVSLTRSVLCVKSKTSAVMDVVLELLLVG